MIENEKPSLKEMSFALQGNRDAIARLQHGGIWRVPVPPSINWHPRVLAAGEKPERLVQEHAEFRLVQVNDSKILFGRFSDDPAGEWCHVDETPHHIR